MTRAWTRWLPAAAIPVVIAAGALVSAAQAGATPDLPVKTADQVLAMAAESTVQALSGTVEQSSKLGLPQLPAGAGPGAVPGGGADTNGLTAAAVLELLTGSHTARVYLDGPTEARVQVLDQLAERDVVRHGDDIWFYSSDTNTATHATLPAGTADGGAASSRHAPAGGSALTPDQLAQRMLAAIDPSTLVTVGRDTTVAGRPAYDLTLRPRADATLIASVAIAVDAETGLPLSVQVQARGQEGPAFALTYTSLSLARPVAARFLFTPPPGATVTEQRLPTGLATGALGARPDATARPPSSSMEPTVTGTGWDAVVEVPAADLPTGVSDSPLLSQATRAVAGGRLLHTALVNVLLTTDGRAFVGSVPLERLQAAAAGA